MRILDKYILKQMLAPFIFGVAAFSTIFISSSFLFRVAQYVTEYGAEASTLVRLFFCLLPEVINYTLPMSVLLGSLLSFNKLSSSSEITAMRSGGISFMRLAAPILVAGFVISMLSVIWAEKVVPPAKYEYNRIVKYEIKHDVKPRGAENIVIKSLRGNQIDRLTYASVFDEAAGKLRNITIEEFEQEQVVRIQRSPAARWENGTWIMEAGSVVDLSGDDGTIRTMNFSEQVLPIAENPQQVTLAQKKKDQMTIAELQEYMGVLEKQKQPTEKYEMEMYSRFSIPLASFFFALIGVPLGVQQQRQSSSMGLGLSVIIIFIYYSIMTFATGLGNGGAIPPLVAALIPNVVCGILGVYLLRQKDR